MPATTPKHQDCGGSTQSGEQRRRRLTDQNTDDQYKTDKENGYLQ